MKKRIISLLLTITVLGAYGAAADAAVLDTADTGAHTEAAVVAADYAEVGSEGCLKVDADEGHEVFHAAHLLLVFLSKNLIPLLLRRC